MVKEKSGFGWANNVTCVRQTNFHDELRIDYKGRSSKVDLLIATKSPLSDPNNKPALLSTWEAMKGEKKTVRDHCSVQFAPAQAELIRSLPPKTKTVIRDMKDWIEKDSVPLKSYPMEAVVMRNWKALGGLHKFRRSDLKRMVLQDLADFNAMRETWPDRYNARRYQDAPFPDGPVLLDPLNPLNNLAPTDPKEVKEIMDKARAS